MEVTVEIKNCRGCHHVGHSGGYTPGGAKIICGHPDIVKIIGCWDWKQRVIKESWMDHDEIPVFCPMLNGYKY